MTKINLNRCLSYEKRWDTSDHLYIQSDYQGKGIGSMVLNDLFSVADAQKKVIRVDALRSSASNEFYVRHGFKLLETAEWDNYYVR